MKLLRTRLLKNPVFAGQESKIFVEVAQFKTQTGYFSNAILAKVYKMLQMIPVTSATTKRNWSIRGAIHTKVRNRLAVETASKLAYIKHNLILEHSDLFKLDRRCEAEASEDDIIIEDCN